MKRADMMKELKEMNVAFRATMKNAELEQLLTEAKAKESERETMTRAEQSRENKAIEQRAEQNKEKKVKYSRADRLANIASLIANDAYDANLTIKLMSNKSVAVKKDKKRLFRLDLLSKEYQLTSDRDTLFQADDRVNAIFDKSKNKFYYRYRTTSKADAIDVMRKTIEMFK